MSETGTFRRDIQGLRALAVVPVVLFHADPALMPGGFVGVDIFFVISGYLITQILLKEIGQGRFSLTGFYVRRVRRLFPALYAMLAATLLFGAWVLAPADFAELGRTALATVGFASNVMFFSLSDYFDGAAELKPLLHTWSLAVEEQFYLAFPLVLAGLALKAPRLLKPTLWLGAALSLLGCVLLSRGHQAFSFYLPFTRAWELLAGALLAARAVPPITDRRLADGLSLVGLALIAASLAFIDRTMVFPGWIALAPVLGTALVLHAGAGRESLGGRLISGAGLVWIGGLSYSLYLWHWPVMAYARYTAEGPMEPGRIVYALFASLVLAMASLRYIERPLLDGRAAPRLVLTSGAGAMLAGAAASLAVIAGQGLPGRFSPAVVDLFASARDASPHRARCHGDGWTPIPYERHCVFGAAGASPRVAVWGDSFGAELVVALGEELAQKGEAALQISTSACPPAEGFSPPFRPRCGAQNAATLAALAADPRIGTVVLVANYDRYGAGTAAMLDGLARNATALRAAGKRVVLTDPVPAMPADAPRVVGLLASKGENPAGYGLSQTLFGARQGPLTARLEAIATAAGARRFSPAATLCGSGLCPAWRADAGVVYFDDVHLSLAGARLLAGGLGAAVAAQ